MIAWDWVMFMFSTFLLSFDFVVTPDISLF